MKGTTKIVAVAVVVGLCWYNWDSIDGWMNERRADDWQSEGDLKTSSRFKRQAWKVWQKIKNSMETEQAELASLDRERMLADWRNAEAAMMYNNEAAKDEYDRIKDQEFSVRQAARILRVKISDINAAIHDGKLKASMKSRVYKVNRIDLAHFWNDVVINGEANKYPPDISNAILQ